MPSPFDGIGVWIWEEKYDPAIVDQCVKAGVTHLLVRAWNGIRPHSPTLNQFLNYRAYVDDGRIPIIPWTYVYGPAAGNDPKDEANSFRDAVLPYKPKALVVDIEHEGGTREYGGQPEATATLFREMRQGLPLGTVLAYTTYDLPSFHALKVRPDGIEFNHIAPFVDVALPQVYFGGRWVRGLEAIHKSLNEYAKLGRPAVPALSAAEIMRTELEDIQKEYRDFSLWRYGTLPPWAWSVLKPAPPPPAPPAGAFSDYAKMLNRQAAVERLIQIAQTREGMLSPDNQALLGRIRNAYFDVIHGKAELLIW